MWLNFCTMKVCPQPRDDWVAVGAGQVQDWNEDDWVPSGPELHKIK